VIRLTPRLASRVLVPASELIFLVGLLVSGTIFFRGKPFEVKAVVISDLESPEDNPGGYAASAAAIAISGGLLAPAALIFYRALREKKRWLARIAAAWFALGVAGAIAIGMTAPFTRGYSPLHIQLAFAAFVGIAGGIWFDILALPSLTFLKWFQAAVFLFLVVLYFVPNPFSDDHLLTSIAFWEWVLCTDVGIALFALARAVGQTEEPARREATVPAGDSVCR
jgi:hypothetical protein